MKTPQSILRDFGDTPGKASNSSRRLDGGDGDVDDGDGEGAASNRNRRRETIGEGIGAVLLALGMTPQKAAGTSSRYGDDGAPSPFKPLSATSVASPVSVKKPKKTQAAGASKVTPKAYPKSVAIEKRRETADPAALLEMLAQFRGDDDDSD